MSSEIEQRYVTAIEAETARYLSGVTDKADIDPVTLLAAKLRMDGSFNRKIFAEAMIKALSKFELGNPKTLYCVELLIRELEIHDDHLASVLHGILDSATVHLSSDSKYRIWRTIEVAQCGLTPADLAGRAAELKEEAPSLWMNLLLLAHTHDNPTALTRQMIDLVEGSAPLLSWKVLRAKLPELRKAYSDAAEYRQQIKIIASAIFDLTERKQFLAAVDKRIGTELAEMLPAPRSSTDYAAQIKEVFRPLAKRAKVWSEADSAKFALVA